MSTILKALRRLEEAKTLQLPRPLREQVATTPAPRRGLGWIAACGAALVGVGLGAAGFIVWPQLGADPDTGRRAAAEVAAGAAATPQRAAVAPPRVAAYVGTPPPAAVDPPPATRSSGLSAAALASRVEVVERIAPPPPEPAVAVSAPPASPPAAVLTAAAASEALPRPAAPPAVEVARSEAPAVGSGRSRPPPAAPSKLVRAFVPGVLVVRTVWHPSAERRVAEIEVEGRPEPLVLHEGDAVGPLVVSEIEPSGVVFLHDEVELRRRVGIR
jgi:hypothetical protein